VSTETARLTFALPSKEAADPCFDEALAEAAIRLLAGGDVGFKLSTRVGASLIPRWKLAVYSLLCRRLPASLRIPPAPAMQRGFYTDWHEAIKACRTPDDQLLVMMVDRAKTAEGWDLPVECRPCDKTDERRFKTLQSVFGDPAYIRKYAASRAHLAEIESRIHDTADRLLTKCGHV
jgi:hypothetical protein